MARLPQVGGDDGNWGVVLNDYLQEAHNSDGSLKPIAQSNIQGLAASLNNKADQSALATEITDRQNGDTASLDRANHTGTQTSSSISDFSTAVTTAASGTFAELDGADFTGTVNLQDGSPAISEDVFNAQGPSGRELAYAESSVLQSGISTVTDITNLTVTFTVGSRPVLVEAILPFVYASASLTTVVGLIANNSNAVRSIAGYTASGANYVFQLVMRERISTPGSYTRKVQIYRSAGSGTISVNYDSTSIASLSVTER